MKILKQLFCLHAWEWDRNIDGDAMKICRHCDKIKSVN